MARGLTARVEPGLALPKAEWSWPGPPSMVRTRRAGPPCGAMSAVWPALRSRAQPGHAGHQRGQGLARPAPSYLFKGCKQKHFSQGLFLLKCDFRLVFSFLKWFSRASICKTSQRIGSAQPEGSCQDPHREPFLQLVDSLPTKNQTTLNLDIL